MLSFVKVLIVSNRFFCYFYKLPRWNVYTKAISCSERPAVTIECGFRPAFQNR
jgi:hypothetical protein